MSIKLLKKLVNHEIKRFYVKNKVDRKDFIIDIEGEFKISFITHNYAQTRGWDNRIIIGATINKKLSKNKINYLIIFLIMYIESGLQLHLGIIVPLAIVICLRHILHSSS